MKAAHRVYLPRTINRPRRSRAEMNAIRSDILAVLGASHPMTVRQLFYRRDLWAAMPVYVEVWCEKDALAGVIMEETYPWHVPLMVATSALGKSDPLVLTRSDPE